MIQNAANVTQLCAKCDLDGRLDAVGADRSAAWLGPAEGGGGFALRSLSSLSIVALIQHALLPLTRCGGFSGFAHAADPFPETKLHQSLGEENFVIMEVIRN